MIAKWAMTLDGHLVLPKTENGGSGTSQQHQSISSDTSRAVVHDLRRRADAIVIGIQTAIADDPLLTARPAGPRPLIRVVLDRHARLSLSSRLVQTAREFPLLVAVGPDASEDRLKQLQDNGCEVWKSSTAHSSHMLLELVQEFGRRQMTNVLVEGGTHILESFYDAGLIDEVWAFLAPKLLQEPETSVGIRKILSNTNIEAIDQTGGDLFFRGLVRHDSLSR
jgi:diaminohydroxyphosphoribosylaminopyrimidine deaminase/5-amino-6-(5-phosphoribosylamino)uracil reductase